ncbi:MAG: hypothetical protein ACOCPV_00360 [Halodesulfurarchaeum sp.]
MKIDTNRRRFLELAGTGGTLALAGCSAPTPEGTLQDESEPDGETATVTVALEIDEAALKAAQEDLVAQIENGTINQTAAQEQLYETERQLLADAASTFREHLDSTNALDEENAATEIGVLLVSGTPAALIDSIARPEVRGLFSAETFEEALAQQDGDG